MTTANKTTPSYAKRFSLGRLRSPDALLIFSAVFVGSVTGLSAIIFIWLLGKISALADWVELNAGGAIGVLVFMGVAGFIVGFLIDRWAKEAKGHGVPEVMEAIAMNGGRIRAQVAAIKVIASSITIGAGGSAGREGPVVQVGSALGSVLGQKLRFSEDNLRTLVACGSAAGIAATFNAPIAGSIFALEVILGRLTVRHFGAIVLSAVSASIVGRAWLGDQPAFHIPAYRLNSLAEIPVYIVLAILASLVAVLFIRVLYKTEGIFDAWAIPLPFKTALGMILTGLTILILPSKEAYGPGMELINDAIAGDFKFTLGFMALLLLGKLLATTFTLGSGNSGGVFAPSLFMGAVLGGMVGTVGHTLWPTVVVNPGAYAIVGMAAVFAGAARAPITAILIVFEMSNDYKLILPLMLATVIATLLAENLFPESIYTLKLKLKGINWQGGRDLDILEGITVNEVVTRQDLETVSIDSSLLQLRDVFAHSHYNGMAVLDHQGKLWGIVTISDIERALAEKRPLTTPASEIGTTWPHLTVTFLDESIGQALSRMGTRGLGRLPVVSRDDPYELVGVVRRQDVIRAYDLALLRRDEIQDRTERIQTLQQHDHAEFVDIFVSQEDAVIGETVREIGARLPKDCVLISIERGGHVIFPHGDTAFRANDHVTAYTRIQDAEYLFTCFHKSIK